MIRASPQEWQAINLLLYEQKDDFPALISSEKHATVEDLWHTGHSIHKHIPGMYRQAVPRLMAGLVKKGLVEKRRFEYKGSRGRPAKMDLYRLSQSQHTFMAMLLYSLEKHTHMTLMRTSFYFRHPLRAAYARAFLDIIGPPLSFPYEGTTIYGLYLGELYMLAMPRLAHHIFSMVKDHKPIEEIKALVTDEIRPFLPLFSFPTDEHTENPDYRVIRERFWNFQQMVGAWLYYVENPRVHLTEEGEDIALRLFESAKTWYDMDAQTSARADVFYDLNEKGYGEYLREARGLLQGEPFDYTLNTFKTKKEAGRKGKGKRT